MRILCSMWCIDKVRNLFAKRQVEIKDYNDDKILQTKDKTGELDIVQDITFIHTDIRIEKEYEKI